jgi:hypothetical protein
MKYKIEKNIPVYEHAKTGTGYLTQIVNEMEIGDSVLVPTRNKSNSLVITIKTLGYKAVTRKDGNKIRVWKLENKNENE